MVGPAKIRCDTRGLAGVMGDYSPNRSLSRRGAWRAFSAGPRRRGNLCLRLRQRDEAVPRGPGGPPHMKGNGFVRL